MSTIVKLGLFIMVLPIICIGVTFLLGSSPNCNITIHQMSNCIISGINLSGVATTIAFFGAWGLFFTVPAGLVLMFLGAIAGGIFSAAHKIKKSHDNEPKKEKKKTRNEMTLNEIMAKQNAEDTHNK